MTDSSAPPEGDSLPYSFVVEERGKRLDQVLRNRVPDLSRSEGQRLIEAGHVKVDGRQRKPAYRVEPGEEVTVILPPDQPEPSLHPEPMPLDILYEDSHLLALNKSASMVVHPGPGHPRGTLVNALLAHYPPIAGVGSPGRAGIVHRLDKETSGVMVIAKTQSTLKALQEQFRKRKVEKAYLALVYGRVEPREGIIEVPIGRDSKDRQKMAPVRDGRYSRTRYRVVRRFAAYTLLSAHPYTGRTHQVRVHLSWLGHPVVGDTVYGRRRQELGEHRHFLHASCLVLSHPATGQEMRFEAPLPGDLKNVLQQLERAGPAG